MAILPPWHMLASMSRKASRVARHLQAHVEALLHAQLLLDARRCSRVRTSTASVAPILLGQFQAVGIDVGDDDVARAGVPDDGRGHDADRPGAGDQHVFAQHGERERRVDGVAERVEDRLHVAGDARVVVPDVGHRQRQVLGERPGAVDADALGVPCRGAGGRPGSCGSGRRRRALRR